MITQSSGTSWYEASTDPSGLVGIGGGPPHDIAYSSAAQRFVQVAPLSGPHKGHEVGSSEIHAQPAPEE